MLARKLDIGFPKAKWCMYGSDYESLTWLDDVVPKPTLEEIEVAYQREKQTHAMKLLRDSRDKLLKKTDLYMIPDYPLTDDMRQKVIKYRQALRDLPQVSSPQINFDQSHNITLDNTSISWPAPPFSLF